MARTLTIAAILALAITGASASALYSTTPQVDGKVYIEGTCSKTLTGGADSIKVNWSDFTESADTIAIKLCFHKDKTVDRPWRKFKDNINKNKQCWQTAKLAKFLKEGIGYSSSGSELIELPMNTAPSTYSVQVLSQAGGTYKQWGDSKTYTQTADKCAHVTTAIYENQPSTLVGTQAFFTVFSIIVLIVSYAYDRSRN
mmetsp:Transcript_7061/g.27771  ORF Transcript_7061/g.27771 Transcript_7061/m.27771 type:complete len:199 (-) Transcript_7061:433-1029(-)